MGGECSMAGEDLKRLVKGYALRDAVKHGGRASVGSIMSMLLGDHPELRPRAREIARIAGVVVNEVNSLTPQAQRRILEEEYPELAEFRDSDRAEERSLPPLPNALEGKVRLRFAPNPDFVIHMGNARPAIINHEYAKMYRGALILRFEDTDPRTKTPLKEAYDLIKEDLKWLGVSWDEEYIQSLRMEVFYDVAREAIARGCAYVDNCGDEGKRLLSEGRYCPSRDYPPEESLELFNRMLEGEFGEGEAVLRMKTDPRHPNPSLRDWVAMRIIDTERYPHPLVGSKYVAWPTYNFAVSVDDHLMGVTHVLRGKEHQLNTEKQLAVYRCMGWSPPEFIHFGRLKLEGFILSKSKIRKLIEDKPDEFLGYDDPRFGTIAGLRRRGILPEAIREVIMQVGVKPTDATISWANLASINRKLLDKRADRIMFVEDPVTLKLSLEFSSCLEARIPYHPDRPERVRSIKVCDGDSVMLSRSDYTSSQRVRLMGLSNFSIEDGMLVETDPTLDYAKRMKLPIVQWVKASDAVKTLVLEPVELSLKPRRGYSEGAIRGYGVDSRLQFVRFGFVRVDSAGEEYTVIYTHK